MSNLNLERRGALAIASAAIIWGFWGVAVHFSHLPGTQAACISILAVGLLAAPTLPRRFPRGWAAWWPLLATGVTDALNSVLYFSALERGPVAVAVLAHYLAPILIALLSPLLLRQWPARRVIVALPVALVGLGLLLGNQALSLGNAATTALLAAASAVFYAIQVLIQKRSGDVLTSAELLVWHALIAGVLLLPFALTYPAPALAGAAWILGGAFLGGVIGGSVFLWGLKHITAAKAGVLTYLEPAVGVAAGVFILGDPLAPLAPVGALLVLGAGLWVLRTPTSA